MQEREQDSASISRRKLVAGAALGAGTLLGVPGVASAARRSPSFNLESHERRLDSKLAPGMYGGPTGFKGAERYQYPLDTEEGRAISALRAMKKAGNAPDAIVVQTLDFAKPQFEKAFPKGALSIVSQFFKETGIKIKFTSRPRRTSTRRTRATPRRATRRSTRSPSRSRRWATSPRRSCSSRSTPT